jgi:hypothetical protein
VIEKGLAVRGRRHTHDAVKTIPDWQRAGQPGEFADLELWNATPPWARKASNLPRMHVNVRRSSLALAPRLD